jgi:hypothetical protein
MAVTGAGSTAEVLGMINAVQADKATADERFQDKAFAGAMSQWQNAFEADRQRNAILLDASLRQLDALNKSQDEEIKRQSELGILAENLQTTDGIGVINDLLKASQVKVASIHASQQLATEQLAKAKGAETAILNNMTKLRGTMTEYGAGRSDSAVADLIRAKLPSPNMANINPADLAVDKYEAASTIKGLMKTGKPEDVQAVAPYVDAKTGDINFDSPRFKGLMASIAESNTEYAKNVVALGAQKQDYLRTQAINTQTATVKNTPQQKEYDRITKITDAMVGQTVDGVKIVDQSQARDKYFEQHPDDKMIFGGIFGIERQIEDEPTKIEKITKKVGAILAASGVDPNSAAGKKAMGKAVITALEDHASEFGMKKADIRNIIPGTPAEKPGWAADWWNTQRLKAGTDKMTEAQKFSGLVDAIKSEAPSAPAALAKIQSQYPEFETAYDASKNRQWDENKHIDYGKALNEATKAVEAAHPEFKTHTEAKWVQEMKASAKKQSEQPNEWQIMAEHLRGKSGGGKGW